MPPSFMNQSNQLFPKVFKRVCRVRWKCFQLSYLRTINYSNEIVPICLLLIGKLLDRLCWKLTGWLIHLGETYEYFFCCFECFHHFKMATVCITYLKHNIESVIMYVPLLHELSGKYMVRMIEIGSVICEISCNW